MIRNTRCAYCGIFMNNIQNDLSCRSVEHMIPNAASKIKRDKSEGDFYVCRKCNLEKSRMDEIMGITTRLSLNGETSEHDLKKFKDRISKNDNAFIRAAKSIYRSSEGYGFSLPITVSQAIEYFQYFAKGQYLKNTGLIFDPQKQIVVIDILGHHAIKTLEKNYTLSNNSNPFDDLTLNKNEGIYNLHGETFIVSSENNHDMVMIFNKLLLVKINILPFNRSNQTLRNKIKRRLYKSWS